MRAFLSALLAVSLMAAAAAAQDAPVPFRSGGKWGYALNGGKKMVVQPAYDAAQPFSEGLAAVRDGSLWGYIDEKGTMRIKPAFGSAGPFLSDTAPAARLGRWGYIDRKGKAVVPFEFEAVIPSRSGAMAGKRGGRWGVIRDGAFEPLKYSVIYPFTEGLARAVYNGKYGYIDPAGREVVPPVYDEAFPFDSGFATASLDGRYGFIARSTLAFKARNDFESIGPFTEGLAHAKYKDSARCGYIDSTGTVKIPFEFMMCAAFSEGLAPALRRFDGKWGFIDRNGTEAIPFKYDEVSGFSGGSARAVRGEKAFYIDREGREYWRK